MKNKAEWERVFNMAPYIETEDFLEDSLYDKSIVRNYKANGKKYPLLSIGIHPNLSFAVKGELFSGITISVAFKKKRGDWWESSFSENAVIPLELFDELTEMLQEAKDKYK